MAELSNSKKGEKFLSDKDIERLAKKFASEMTKAFSSVHKEVVTQEEVLHKIREQNHLSEYATKKELLQKEHEQAIKDIESSGIQGISFEQAKRAEFDKYASDVRKLSEEESKARQSSLDSEQQITNNRLVSLNIYEQITTLRDYEASLEDDITSAQQAQQQYTEQIKEKTAEIAKCKQDIATGDETARKIAEARLGTLAEERNLLIDNARQSKEIAKTAQKKKDKASEQLNQRTQALDRVQAQKQPKKDYDYYSNKKQSLEDDIDDKETEKVSLEAERELAIQSGDDKLVEELNKRLDEVARELTDLTDELDSLELDKIESRDTKAEGKESLLQKQRDAAEKRKDREARKEEREFAKTDEGKQILKETAKDEMLNNLADSIEGMGDKLVSKLADFSKDIDNNINTFTQYQGRVDSRLQESGESYKDLTKKVTANIAFSPFVKQADMIEKITQLVDTGVAYNVDLRAFLGTVSENIAATFDAFDANLLKIVRLQQADTTAARLGMEASLTKLFNKYFQDNSYLTDAFDSVAGSILDASAQMTRDASMSFEYVVQKWLGALYSVGLSQDAVNTIAQGINYLGTGNVEALNSNESLQTLMAMSASRAGINYADILTGGLDANITNDLMKSMVEYLASIANNTENNQVTKSAYANLFGVNMGDLRAIQNLTQDNTIANLHQNMLDYNGAITELNTQFGQYSSRVHMSQWIDNIMANVLMSASTGIGNNPALYGMWKVFNIIEDFTGGIHLPAISVMGNMVDLSTFTIEGIAKGGIAGLGMMSSLLSGLFSGGGVGNTFSLDAWGFDESTKRGSGVVGISSGTASGVSESGEMSMTGSSSSDDVKNTGMSDKTDEADKDKETTNKNVKDEANIYTQIYEAIATDDTTVVEETIKIAQRLAGMGNIEKLLGADRIFLTADAMIAKASGVGSVHIDEATQVLTYSAAQLMSANAETYSSMYKATQQELTSVVGASTTPITTSISTVNTTIAQLKNIVGSIGSVFGVSLGGEQSEQSAGETGGSKLVDISPLETSQAAILTQLTGLPVAIETMLNGLQASLTNATMKSEVTNLDEIQIEASVPSSDIDYNTQFTSVNEKIDAAKETLLAGITAMQTTLAENEYKVEVTNADAISASSGNTATSTIDFSPISALISGIATQLTANQTALLNNVYKSELTNATAISDSISIPAYTVTDLTNTNALITGIATAISTLQALLLANTYKIDTSDIGTLLSSFVSSNATQELEAQSNNTALIALLTDSSASILSSLSGIQSTLGSIITARIENFGEISFPTTPEPTPAFDGSSIEDAIIRVISQLSVMQHQSYDETFKAEITNFDTMPVVDLSAIEIKTVPAEVPVVQEPVSEISDTTIVTIENLQSDIATIADTLTNQITSMETLIRFHEATFGINSTQNTNVGDTKTENTSNTTTQGNSQSGALPPAQDALVDAIVAKLLSRISDDGGLEVKVKEISNDQSNALWVQRTGGDL